MTLRVHLCKTQVAVNEIITKNARRVNALKKENCSSSFALLVKLKTTLFSELLYSDKIRDCIKYALIIVFIL